MTEVDKNDHEDNHNVSRLIDKLEKIQDMLGNIHDYDITTAYLKRHNTHTALSLKIILP